MKITLVGTSNGKAAVAWPQISKLQQLLLTMKGVTEVDISSTVFQKGNPSQTMTASKRAAALMEILLNDSVDVILDISGGDACNEILPYMDFELLVNCQKSFFGYSDVSVLLNVLAEKTSMVVFNFNTMTLLGENGLVQLELLYQAIQSPEIVSPLLEGVVENSERVRGGNLRCTLKLAGTAFWPDIHERVYLVESMSGHWDRIRSYLSQLELIGVFSDCKALIVGQFQELEQHQERELLWRYLEVKASEYAFELRETPYIGHSQQTVPIRY